MNCIKSAEQLLANHGQSDPTVLSTKQGDLGVSAPSQEDVPLPNGKLHARESSWMQQDKSVTSMHGQGVVAPPRFSSIGCLSATHGFCQDQGVAPITPVHTASPSNESQAQNLLVASWQSIARKSSQSQSASKSPQTLKLSSLVPADQPSPALQPWQSQATPGPHGPLQSAVWPPVPQQPSRDSSKWWSTAPDCDPQHVDVKLINSASTTASRLSPKPFSSNIIDRAAGDAMLSTTMLCNSPSYSVSDGAASTSNAHAMTSNLMQKVGQTSSSDWTVLSACGQLAPCARLEPAPEFSLDNQWAPTV